MPVLPGDDSWTWTDSTGSVLDLTDRTKWAIEPGDGFGIADVENVERNTPYGPGAQALYSRPKPRDITFRIFIKAGDLPTQQTLRQTLVAAFSPFKNAVGLQGNLKVVRVNSTTRQIDCAVKKGPTFDAANRHGLSRREPIVLHAANPFWYDPTAVTVTLPYGASSGGSPLTYPQTLPFTLGGATGSGIAAASTTNPGDWESFPVISVPGPASNITVANYTAGKALTWTGSVPAGYTLTLDCTYLNPQVTLSDSLGNVFNGYYALSTASQFWSVLPGVNTLGVTATSIGTAPSLVYYARYSGI